MRCSSCEPLLDRYVEGTLAPRQMTAVASHLRSCDRCSSLIDELRVIDGLLATTKPVELAPNFTFAVMAEARTLHIAQPRTFSPWAVLSFYLVGAWIALVAMYLVFGVHIPGLPSVVGTSTTFVHEMFATMVGVARALGPSTPITVAVVSSVLFLDALLTFALIYFYRSIRPRLAIGAVRSEAR